MLPLLCVLCRKKKMVPLVKVKPTAVAGAAGKAGIGGGSSGGGDDAPAAKKQRTGGEPEDAAQQGAAAGGKPAASSSSSEGGGGGLGGLLAYGSDSDADSAEDGKA